MCVCVCVCVCACACAKVSGLKCVLCIDVKDGAVCSGVPALTVHCTTHAHNNVTIQQVLFWYSMSKSNTAAQTGLYMLPHTIAGISPYNRAKCSTTESGMSCDQS